MKVKRIFVYLFGISILFVGCSEDYMDVQPTNVISKKTLDDYANASPEAIVDLTQPIVNGLYSTMTDYQGNHDVFGQKAVDLWTDLNGVDMVQKAHHHFGWDYLMENRDYNYRRTTRTWELYYKLIFSSNEVLKLMPETTDDSRLISIKGQALAIRAYAYYYLIRIYQFTYDGSESRLGVPLYRLTGAEYEDGRRASVQLVYDGIIEDFTKAYDLLSTVTRSSKNEINNNAVALYLADAYLTMKNYTEAAAWAKKAYDGVSLMSNAEYTQGFNSLSNSEFIWGADITPETSTFVASWFSHVATFTVAGGPANGYAQEGYAPKAMYSNLANAVSATDIRRSVIIFADGTDKYKSKKFLELPNNDEDVVYCRAAEAYLIEAEALARSGDESGARQVLFNLVSKRDPKYVLSTNSGDALIEEILLQKRIELWAEGRSYFDLKRLKRGIDRNVSGSNHRLDAMLNIPANDKRWVLAIPMSEIDNNPNIVLDENQ